MQSIAPLDASPRALSPRAYERASGRTVEPSPLSQSHLSSPLKSAPAPRTTSRSVASPTISTAGTRRLASAPQSPVDQPMASATPGEAGLLPAKAYNSQANSPVESAKSSPSSTSNVSKGRNVSAPNPPMSPPQSPADGGAPRLAARVDAKAAPRNASIDSTGSGASAGSQQQDPTSPNSAEIAAMIAAAGSAEAVIAQLLREKKQAAAQNAQLFRLVQKQRSLIYGLNQDLEKAAQEKEKFRKSVRDGSAHMSPARGAKVDALRKQSPTGSTSTQSEDELPIQRHSVEEPIKPSPAEMETQRRLQTDMLQTGYQSKSSSQAQSPIHGPSPVTPIAPLSITKREKAEAATAASPSSFAARRSFGAGKKSPGSGPASPVEEAASPSTRKGPPAPLNLGMQSDASVPKSPNEYGPEDHSDSDYNEAEVDRVTGLERGRKKTRAEDDYERELLIKHEQDSRSQSKKQKDSKSGSMSGSKAGSKPSSLAPKDSRHLDPAQYPLPKSPLPGHLGSNAPNSPAGSFRSEHRSEHASIAGMLSGPPSAVRQTFIERSSAVSPTPISPGLPLSPRPADRPVGAPTPRQPREGYITSPPVQERSAATSPPKSPLKSPRPIQTTNLSIPTPVEQQQSKEKAQSPKSPKLTKAPKSPRLDSAPKSPRSPPPKSPMISPKSPKKASSAELVLESKPVPNELMVEGVYRGLVSEDHPTLLLMPSALRTIGIKVTSSRLKPSRQSTIMLTGAQEEPVFTLGIVAKSNSQQLWRIEKPIMSLPQLDYQLKQVGEVEVKLPERSLFSGHAPAKIDARRVALEGYFEALLNMSMPDAMGMVVCRYLSTHVIPCDEVDQVPQSATTDQASGTSDTKITKEGYLTKRGKQFGGWKARFFVLDDSILRYYDAPGGSLQGSIKLFKAQIGRQSVHTTQSPAQDGHNPDNQFRHAFLIMEPKKKDNTSHVRHVLCAENDKERDEWVFALLQYVNTPPDDAKAPVAQRTGSGSKKQAEAVSEAERFNSLKSLSYEETQEGEAPRRSASIPRERTASPGSQFGSSYGSSAPAPSPAISGPKNGSVIQDAGAWGNKSLDVPKEQKTSKEQKKRSMWGFRDKIAEFSGYNQSQTQNGQATRAAAMHQPVGFGNTHRDHVFGVPLREAVEFCIAPGSDLCLPAVVYRCLSYLDVKKAELEEGIFRLSGSNTLVRNLKEKFNTEGDFDLLAQDTYYDVHAVASLLKLYLRELPTTVLTKQLHMEFLAALDIEHKEERLMAYCVLVSRLPLPNWTLVRSISEYLLKVINNAGVNKMSVRNVGIVFAPTLNIPAPVFASFLTDFEAIFETDPPENAPQTFIGEPGSAVTAGSSSPRKHSFSDSGTPSGQGFSVQTPLHTPSHPPGPGLPSAPNDRTSYMPGRVTPSLPTPRTPHHPYNSVMHTPHSHGTAPYETHTREQQQATPPMSHLHGGAPYETHTREQHQAPPLHTSHSHSGVPYETHMRESHTPHSQGSGHSTPNPNDAYRRPSTSGSVNNQGVPTRPSYETSLPWVDPSSGGPTSGNFGFNRPHYETNLSFEAPRSTPTGPPPSAASASRQSTLVTPDRPKYASGIGQLEVMRDAKSRRRESAMMHMGNMNGNYQAAKRKSSLPQMGNVPESASDH